jgi:hypothetical protein
MVNKTGVWIDRRQAIVARLAGNNESSVHVTSNMEKQERRAGDREGGSFEPLNVPSDDTRDRKETAELNKYFDDVISHLKDSQAIYICGPGEAKKHLVNRIEKNGSLVDNLVVETADHMTEAQFVARVREHFQVH